MSGDTNSVVHYRSGTLYHRNGRLDDARREVELYKKYKDVEEKLTALYQELMIHPEQAPTQESAEK